MASVLFVIAEHCYGIVCPSACENQTPQNTLKGKLTNYIVGAGRAPTRQSCKTVYIVVVTKLFIVIYTEDYTVYK